MHKFFNIENLIIKRIHCINIFHQILLQGFEKYKIYKNSDFFNDKYNV